MKKLAIALTTVLLAACSSTDLFDEKALENDTKKAYTENFVKAYPNVSLNQSWDFSRKYTTFSLPSDTYASHTRATNYTMKEGERYDIPDNVLSWMKAQLKEEANNRSKGTAFYMKVPNNEFTIVPIYQGHADLYWELHMVVDGVDINVWEKSKNLWMKTSATQTEWTEVGSRTGTKKENSANTLQAVAVQATPYIFSGLPYGEDMYFYLKVTDAKTSNYKKYIGTEQSSLSQMMVALTDCPTPTNLEEGTQVVILGCEDLSDSSSDWDMNDVVFMIYGKPEVPQQVVIKEGDPVVQKKTVRYMIEDLGATDDFDFNDIVVDVSNIVTTTPIYTNNVITSWKEVSSRQEAVIRHLGGTLPFKLKIGNTEFEEHAGVLGSDPDEVYEVEGWDINRHNINVQVKQNANSTAYNTIPFPKAGEAPMIIAVDPTQNWMNERVSVPEDWFTIPED